jgi:hypothetical protein
MSIQSGALNISPQPFHASLAEQLWDPSRQTQRGRLRDSDKRKFKLRWAEEQTKNFGSGGDVLADDSHTIEAVCKGYYAPSPETVIQILRWNIKITHLLINPYDALSPTTPQ